MSDRAAEGGPVRSRRPPPPLRRVEVRRIAARGPRLLQVTLGGPDLAGLVVEQPAASVRLLVPSAGTSDLVMPTWQGNEFLLPDGRRPALRTFTPRRVDLDGLELEVEIFRHGDGVAARWAEAAGPGDPAAVSGPGRGYDVDADAPGFVLAGDESAIPAISQLLEVLPADRPVQVLVEVAAPDGRVVLPPHGGSRVDWLDLAPGAVPGDALVPALAACTIEEGARIWAAGEAAAMQRIRRHLLEDRSLPRAQTWVRGYWKRGRAGDDPIDV